MVFLGALMLAPIALAGTSRDVAVVVGNPIRRQTFDHWMAVAAKGDATRQPGSLVIVPTDPPTFAGCVRQVRRQIPSLRGTPNRTIRADCGALFKALSSQVLDFLIRARWYELRATADGIVITDAQVKKRFEDNKRSRFKTDRQFRQFLRLTGQSVTDVMFRVRANITYEALLRKEHLNATALSAEAKRLYKSSTTCAPFYVMADCVRG